MFGGGRRARRWAFEDAIDEAEVEANADPEDRFMRGYLMGLCMGAALAGQDEDVWASPERHRRQKGRTT